MVKAGDNYYSLDSKAEYAGTCYSLRLFPAVPEPGTQTTNVVGPTCEYGGGREMARRTAGS
jgi:hypothetical protein